MNRKIFTLFACLVFSLTLSAQGSFEEFKKQKSQEYSAFRDSKKKEYEDFRKKLNDEYAAFIEKSWQDFQALQGIEKPKEKGPVPPVVYPKDDKPEPIKDSPKPIEEVVPVVKPEPQPEPVAPVKEEEKPSDEYFKFNYFGTTLSVRLAANQTFTLKNCSEKEIARMWRVLSESENNSKQPHKHSFNKTLSDCLKLRDEHKLCDWAYLLMLNNLSECFLGKGTNEAAFFTAYLYCQSGYKMRLATANNRLYLLYASKHLIYDEKYWVLDGEKYYSLNCKESRLSICKAAFPQEKPLSLWITTQQEFANNASENRSLKSKSSDGMAADVKTNKCLINFFGTYPRSMVNDDFGTQWAMYANTPLSSQAKASLYPDLKKQLKGKSELEAVNCLLNFVQTAFEYEYDDKVWGGDRVFFAEETLFYPYNDCEDRSILFSNLVRDLLGLEVVLVYYPGHLATAVAVSEGSGDYYEVNGKRYFVADPTYIGAPLGLSMPDLRDETVKIILLSL